MRRVLAQRDPDAELPGPLRHGVRDDAEDPDRGEHERDPTERRHQQQAEPGLGHPFGQVEGHRRHPGDRQILVHVVHHGRGRVRHASRRHGGFDRDID